MGGRLLQGPTMVGRASDWKEELGRFLNPFLDRLGHKARRQMCPLYVSGLNRSWRSQDHSADGGAAWVWRIRSNCSPVSLTLARGEVPVMRALRLFLPASWTSKRALLKRAGVPAEYRTARTKPEMARD